MSRGPARIEIVPFTPAHLPALIRFSEHTWDRPRSEAYYRWRYLEAPAERALLAVRGDEIVAMIGAFRRDYRIGGETRTCLETHDWYCLPEYRGSGLGVRVLQTLMTGDEPIVAVGGTADTLALLPRLGWRKMTTATCHQLPLDATMVAGSLRRRFAVPLPAGRAAYAVLGRPWFRPRARRRPPAGQMREAPGAGEELGSLYDGETGYRLLPLLNLPHRRWLIAGAPTMGRYVVLHFLLKGSLRGWTMLRLYGTEGGRRITLVDAYAPRPDVALYTWMVSLSLLHLAGERPLTVDTQTTCPILRQALARNRFVGMGSLPIHVWPAGFPGDLDPVHLVQDGSDGPLIPYPGG